MSVTNAAPMSNFLGEELMEEPRKAGRAGVGVGEWAVPAREEQIQEEVARQQLPLSLLVYLLLEGADRNCS